MIYTGGKGKVTNITAHEDDKDTSTNVGIHALLTG